MAFTFTLNWLRDKSLHLLGPGIFNHKVVMVTPTRLFNLQNTVKQMSGWNGLQHMVPTLFHVRLEWSPTYGLHLVSCQVGMVSNIWSPPCFMITITSLIIILKMTFQDTSGSFQMVGFEPGESGGLCGHTPFELVTAVKACLTSHFSLGS